MLYHLSLARKLHEDTFLELRGECKAKGLVAESLDFFNGNSIASRYLKEVLKHGIQPPES